MTLFKTCVELAWRCHNIAIQLGQCRTAAYGRPWRTGDKDFRDTEYIAAMRNKCLPASYSYELPHQNLT